MTEERDHSTPQLHELTVVVLERLAAGDAGALDKLCDEHPDLGDELRKRVHALGKLNLLPADAAAQAFPERLGEYRLVRQLGGGGMGVVYEAVQESLGRTVALKLIRPEHLYFARSRERFRRETEAVARLAHPGIVAIHTVGEERGTPYFAMEMIHGATLGQVLEHLSGAQPESLIGHDLLAAVQAASARFTDDAQEETPELFEGAWWQVIARVVLQVAEAVAHAHARGVLHRDIKPSNVSVTPAGRVVLLDFGLAGVEQDARLTVSGSALGSVLYMAPEQVLGRNNEIDARTDVYSLAVTLFELLALEPPFSASDAQQARASILEGQHPQLRELNREVPRDLELVCLKGMDRDRARRYAAMEAFAQDLRNVLRGRPVVARPPSAAYRARRWIARHPTASASMALAALLVMVTPTALYLQQRASSTRLRAALDSESAAHTLADQRAREADQVAGLLVDLFGGADPFAEGRRDVTARELLDRGLQRVEEELAGQPAVQARMYERIGQSYISLDLFDQALVPLDRALALHRRLEGEEAIDTAQSMVLLGSAARCAHRPGTTEMLRRANELLDAAANAPADARIRAKYVLALSVLDDGRADEAVRMLDEARDLLPEDPSKRRDLPWTVLATRAATFAKLGRFSEAEGAARDALELDREVRMTINPWRDVALDTLGVALRARGRAAEACDAYEQLLPGARSFYAADSAVLAEFEMHLAAARFELGQMTGLADVFLRSFEVLSRRNGIVRSKSLAALSYAANALIRDGRFDECARWLDEVDARATESLERVDAFDALLAHWRGLLALARGERMVAVEQLRRAVELSRDGDRETHATYQAMLARALVGDPATRDDAARLAAESVASGAPDVKRIARFVRASAALASGDLETAEPLLREAAQSIAIGSPPVGADAACAELWAELLISRGDTSAGCPLLASALASLELRLGPEHAELREIRARLEQTGITVRCTGAAASAAQR